MMEGVESTPYPEATETRMGVTSGLAIQLFTAGGGGIWFIWFVWFISFVWFIWSGNETNQISGTN
jgi:hypothetical protein